MLSSSRDAKLSMKVVGILMKVLTLIFLEDTLNHACLMLLVKDGKCAVLHPSLRMHSMRFLLKSYGRYSLVVVEDDISLRL